MAVNNSTPPVRLRRAAACEYLARVHSVVYAPQSLARFACTGGGPEFVRIGHLPLYETAALDAWVASRTSRVMRSTSDVGDRHDRAAA
jgi:hypothetical protein